MTYVVAEVSGMPKSKVIGSGTVLDTARLRYLLADYFEVSSKNVHAYILGEHGDSSLVPWNHCYVGCKNIIVLSELIRQSSQVFIMGHRNSDNDAIGAAAGLVCLSRKLNTQAKIVTDLTHSAALPLIERLKKHGTYEDVFVTPDDALLNADPQSLLIIVDTNRPEQVESRPLLEAMTRVALIDHHRKAAQFDFEPLLTYIEPAASSASELVAETLEYTVGTGRLLREEADLLLAGITLDTKQFSKNTAARTYGAALYLRDSGADPGNVSKLFKTDLHDLQKR